jgi:CubicO group peptidase (beta-lactamase class C family)
VQRRRGLVLVALLSATSLNALPDTVNASVGRNCDSIGQSGQAEISGKMIKLVCLAEGAKRVWKQPPRGSFGASIYKAGAEKFVSMARAVRTREAQCMLVMKNGSVIGEWNWDSHFTKRNIELASVTKSFGATLIGIAVSKGIIAVDDLASKYITEWQGTPKEGITIRHLLAMTSGLNESRPTVPARDYYNTGGVDTIVSLVGRASNQIVGTDSSAPRYRTPGRSFSYLDYTNSAALSVVLRRATGENVRDFAERELLGPLGMSINEMTNPAAGDSLLGGWYRGGCDDVAKLVQLYLNRGRWGGVQILNREFIRDAVTPQVTCGDCTSSSTERSIMYGAYGLHWWTNRISSSSGTNSNPVQTFLSGSQRFPNIPADMFFALGICAQIGAGLPKRKLVVVVLRKGCDDPVQRAANWGPAFTLFMDELARTDS